MTGPADIEHAAGPSAPLARSLRTLGTRPDATAHRLFVPGRIEIFGKHTDYAGGRSLIGALDRGFQVLAAASHLPAIRVVDAVRKESVTVSFEGSEPDAHAPGWAIYPATVVRRLLRDLGPPPRGVDIAIASDLPAAAGMSSSSAFVVSVFAAIDRVTGLRAGTPMRTAVPDDLALADYLGAVEAGRPFPGLGDATAGAGSRGGAQDHAAILTAEAGHLHQVRWAPSRHEQAVALPEHWRFVIATSGVVAEKAAGVRDRYNRLADLTSSLTRRWSGPTRPAVPHLGAILDLGPTAVVEARRLAIEAGAPDEAVRLDAFVEETDDIVPRATEAFARADAQALGRLADRSQHLAESSLGNQVEETIALQRLARACGAFAASAFGAGFGGAVWALVPRADAGAFVLAWQRAYRKAFPARSAGSAFFAVELGGGVGSRSTPSKESGAAW